MTKEELLIQRYKAIAPYPGSRFEVGDILYKYVFETSETGRYTYTTNLASPLQGVSLHREHVESMPHLFKPLQWWEDREPEDMPEYIKHKAGTYLKLEITGQGRPVLDGVEFFSLSNVDILPATKEEYEAYINMLEENGRDQPHPPQ